jgi:very-short-patch-repair endonuclease
MKRPPGKDMLERTRGLRREMTPQEKILWSRLRAGRLGGWKFRRQTWLGGYIPDFACPEARLIVEADGRGHTDDSAYDAQRSATLGQLGWRTLRFWNNEINENLAGVVTTILAALPSPSHRCAAGPSLSPQGRGDCEGRRSEPSPYWGEGGAHCDSNGRVRA